MLANIHVKNMALIKEADISLGKGLNILSGETGAGKSILLGSIAVALGLQNFKGFAREDADYALSELVFVIENEEQRQALLELEIPVEDGEVIISRRLSKGRTTSKINGETVPVSMVRKAGTLLIDIQLICISGDLPVKIIQKAVHIHQLVIKCLQIRIVL